MTISNQDSRSILITHDGTTALYNYTFQEPDSANIAVYIKEPDPTAEVKLTPGTDYSVAVDSDSVGGSITLAVPTNFLNLSIIRIARETPMVQASRFSNAGSAYPETFEAGLDLLTRQVQELQDLMALSLGVPITRDTHFDARAELIKNLLAPVDENDAATKSWVQSLILDPGPDVTPFAAARLLETTFVPWLNALNFSPYFQTLINETTFIGLINEMGFSTVVEDILKSGTAASIFDDLGVVAFSQTLFSDTSAAARRASIGIPSQIPIAANAVVNADVQVWQNGTSFTAPDDNTYFADQFIILSDGDGVVDIAKQSSLPWPPGARGAAVITQAAGQNNKRWSALHIIESERVLPLRNKRVSLSIDVSQTGDLTNMKMYLIWSDETADAPTRDVVSVWTASLTDPTLVFSGTGWTYVPSGSLAFIAGGITTTYNVENILVPSTANNLGILLVTFDSSFTAGAVVRTSKWNLVESEEARPFVGRTLSEELVECERFFEKTFELDTVPAVNAGVLGALHTQGIPGGGTEALVFPWRFRTRKIKTPTVVRFNPGAGGAATEAKDAAGENYAAVSIVAESDSSVHLTGHPGGVNGDDYDIHATADARF